MVEETSNTSKDAEHTFAFLVREHSDLHCFESAFNLSILVVRWLVPMHLPQSCDVTGKLYHDALIVLEAAKRDWGSRQCVFHRRYDCFFACLKKSDPRRFVHLLAQLMCILHTASTGKFPLYSALLCSILLYSRQGRE